MYRPRATEDPARRWRKFCRKGWRMAWMFAALWFGGLALLFRVAPAPEPAPRESSGSMTWCPAEGGAAMDIRTLWTPSAFALSTPAGFSHALRRERAGLTPPVQTARPDAAYLEPPRPAPSVDLSVPEPPRFVPRQVQPGSWSGSGVFPPRVPVRESPRMGFPEEWESRLFSGIDLDFGAWTNEGWSARVEMRFDGHGVPVSMLLAKSSGLPDVDRRLARSANGWRLLEPSAPRTGTVEWSSPAPVSAASNSAAKGAP
jgi:hypothetical protein